MTDKGDSRWRYFRKSPQFELLTSTAIVAVHALASPKLRIASDALFLEGVTLSLIGSLVAYRAEHPTSHSPGKTGNETSADQQAEARRASLGSLLKRRYGYRILFLGLILIAAAIVIGELFVRPAG